MIMTTQRRFGLAILALAGTLGCRVGGPTTGDDGDPADASRPVDAAAADTATNPPDPTPDAGPVVVPDASADDASAAVDAPDPGDGGCAPTFTSKVCDPVCNTGCAALTRCDVSDKPQEGACIGIWISGEGTACWKTATTNPCAEKLTCVDGKCRRLCYHDSDCAAGSCCKESVMMGGQASGYTMCGPCAP
jgi:hypothetical protein